MGMSNYPRGFSHGVALRGLPILNSYSGEVFWVDDSGSDGAKGTFERPFATLDYAIGKCAAGRGDLILAKQGHAETVTAAITLDVEGVSIVGLGVNGQLPAITGNGAIDAMTITADNCLIAGLQFPAPETDAQTADINIAAAGCSVIGTKHIGSQTGLNKVSFVTITVAGHDFLLEGIITDNVTVDVVTGISIEGACARGIIKDCLIGGSFSTAALADGATATLLKILNSVFKNTKAAAAVVSFSNNSTGFMRDCFVDGRHTTIASNLVTGTGMAFYETKVVEEAGVNALLLPVVDAD
jgi:hypothetical protein